MARGCNSIWASAFLAFIVLYLLILGLLPIVISAVLRSSHAMTPSVSRFLTAAESLYSVLMTVFAAGWIFLLGAVFASFLNVVAFRVPRGESILGSSRCPYCRTRLRFRDNVPVWGWLKNRGRCYTCRLPIARRYVLVEITLGSIFLFVVFLELATGGATLPIRAPDRQVALIRMLFEPAPDLVVVTIYHLILILGLFLFALIDWGQDRLPASVFLISAVSVAAFALLFPDSWLINWDYPWVKRGLPYGRMHLAVGMAAGAAVGWLTFRTLDFLSTSGRRESRISPGGTIAGAAVGWQSVLLILILYCLLKWLLGRRKDRGGLWKLAGCSHALLLGALLLHLSTWRWLNWLG